jgi:hypothetical protein
MRAAPCPLLVPRRHSAQLQADPDATFTTLSPASRQQSDTQPSFRQQSDATRDTQITGQQSDATIQPGSKSRRRRDTQPVNGSPETTAVDRGKHSRGLSPDSSNSGSGTVARCCSSRDNVTSSLLPTQCRLRASCSCQTFVRSFEPGRQDRFGDRRDL